MNAYEKFEDARERFEAATLFAEKHLAGWQYLDAAMVAMDEGYIFSDQLLFVWKLVKEYL